MSTDYYLVHPNGEVSLRGGLALDDDEPVAHTWYGGRGVGLQLSESRPIESHAVLLDEYGRLVCICDLRESVGAGA